MTSWDWDPFVPNETSYEFNLSTSSREVLNSKSSSQRERISSCWMGTEYLAGLYEGTSQNYILLLLSLHVLGISISKEFFVFLMLF